MATIQPGQNTTSGSRLDRRFDTLRSKVEQEANKANEAQQEAFARRGAATGLGNTGAFMKLGAKAQQEGEANKRNALMDVESQREAAQAGLDEANAQREFARYERQDSERFQRRMAQEAQQFAKKERVASQAFASSEAAAQRGFSREIFDKEMAFKDRVQSAAEGQFLQNLDRVDRQFWEDNRINDFNMKMAEKMFNKKDMFSNIGSIWDRNIASPAGSVWSGD